MDAHTDTLPTNTGVNVRIFNIHTQLANVIEDNDKEMPSNEQDSAVQTEFGDQNDGTDEEEFNSRWRFERNYGESAGNR